jgi:hypothetical protein
MGSKPPLIAYRSFNVTAGENILRSASKEDSDILYLT